jgi:hypothetical protein
MILGINVVLSILVLSAVNLADVTCSNLMFCCDDMAAVIEPLTRILKLRMTQEIEK